MTTALLLDADIIAFQVAAVSQRSFQFPGCEPSVVVDDWEEVVPRIDDAVNKLTAALDGLPIICLSCPTEENWRLKVLPSYKANRDYSKRPVHLAAVKDYLAAEYPSYRKPELEADDIMGILSTMKGLPPNFVAEHPAFKAVKKKVIVSEDKDMEGIPGWLYNPAKDRKPRLIDRDAADRWHLFQTLVGDTVDNYKGCPGIGKVKAERVLSSPAATCVVSGDPWAAIVETYESKGLTEADALVQARVARICRITDYDFKNKEVILWTPDSSPSRPTSGTA